MLVTVNTDASFSSQYKIGAYAFWIVSNAGVIKKYGVLKEAINPTDCEIRCIGNALACLLNQNYPTITKVIINSDALHAFPKIGPSAKPNTPEAKCYDLIRKLRVKYMTFPLSAAIFHEFRHVKAHTNSKQARSVVNDWCDVMARQTMRDAARVRYFELKKEKSEK